MPPTKPVKLRRRLAYRCILLPRVRAEEKTLLPPFFVTKSLRKSIERLLPAGHHQRLRLYFDTYGCLRCSCNDLIYGGNGFCAPCLNMLQKRLRKVDAELRERLSETPPDDMQEAYLRPYRSARKLLADLVPKTDKRTGQTKPEPRHPPKVYVKHLP